MDFTGKTAISTGAASGMGLLFSQNWAELGGNVVLCDINEEVLNKKVEEINTANRETNPELMIKFNYKNHRLANLLSLWFFLSVYFLFFFVSYTKTTFSTVVLHAPETSPMLLSTLPSSLLGIAT